MNESTRTLTFVGVAVVLAAVAYGTHVATRPPSLADFSDEREEFYPDFKDPLEATGLRVAAYNEDAGRVDVFSVQVKDGRWTIPSHHNYPADGEERLANTATSIIGLTREALASTSADDHKRLGVLDPLDESIAGTEGRGDRITLTKGDEVLADYIIGTKIEDGPENTYHVRRADQNRTYRVTLEIDISTKFADWIEPDLLDFRRGDIRQVFLDRYSIDETRGVVVPGDQSKLSRSSQDDPWQLEGLDETTEEVKTSTVNQIINALEDLAIVGVRPKPSGLSADLKKGSIVAADGSVSMTAFQDLQRHGFFLLRDGSLKSNEGEIRLALADGAEYVLGFGEVFTGSDVDIEVGGGGSSDNAEEANSEDAQEESGADAESAQQDEGDAATDEEDNSLKKSRYLFITARFDESVIEPLEDKPAKPEPPEGYEESDTDSKAETETGAESDGGESDSVQAENSEADSPEEGEKDQPDPKAEYEKALAEYETKLKEWEQKEKAHKEKLEAGRKRVEELNGRFADWYYAISAETFDDIRVSRQELVEKKEPETTAGEDSGAAAESVAPPSLEPANDSPPPAETPGEIPLPAAEEKSAGEPQKPAADKPQSEAPQESSPSNESSASEPDTGSESSQEL